MAEALLATPPAPAKAPHARAAVSVFELFRIGIGPSSSHTVGPMRAARRFVEALRANAWLGAVDRVRCELWGSLGATGRGHATDRAVMLGLQGLEPETLDPACIEPTLDRIRAQRRLALGGRREIAWDEPRDLVFRGGEHKPFHPNALVFEALDRQGQVLHCATYYSIGGGFLVQEGAQDATASGVPIAGLAHPFSSAAELLAQCRRSGLSVARVMAANERAWRDAPDVQAGLMAIWRAMQDCVARGLAAEGELGGGLRVRRRAKELHDTLTRAGHGDPLQVMDWVNVYAMAVNEENAAGGRVVTAPTNGAAGVVPAVLHYYWHFVAGASDAGVADFLLTAGAIGGLYKLNASISGAEVGCQGEVGVACSMAAGALCAVMGGSPEQVENAAEIGMEHHLGLTCDPVGGLVQVPCIERNAVGAVKAINAARLALRGDGRHRVSLDEVIETMRQTGADMKTHYKETSLAGLAVNVVEC